MGFRTKLVVGTVSLVLGFVAAASLVLSVLIGRVAEQQIARDLDDGRRSYDNYMTLRWRSLRDSAEFLSQTSILTASAGTGDRDTVNDVLSKMEIPAALSFVLIADLEGRALGSSRYAPMFPANLLPCPGLGEALDGSVADGIWRLDDALYLVGIAPLALSGSLVGVLAVGERLDDDDARRISQVTGRDVVMLHRDLVVAQAWRDSKAGELSAAEQRQLVEHVSQFEPEMGNHLELPLAGRRRLALAVPMHPHTSSGTLVLSRGLDEITELYNAAYVWLWVFGLTIGSLGVLFALHTAAKLSRPLRELIHASDAMSHGDLSARVSTESADDMGRLSESFNQMAVTIEKLVDDVCEQAQRAESASRAKDGFLASVSHELHTPLTSIKASTEILLGLEGQCSPDEQAEFLQIICHETDRLGRLISQVLDFAMIESGKMTWSVSHFDLRDVVHDAAERVASLARERSVRIITRCDRDISFSGDEARLQQVITSLLANACKFAPPDTDVVLAADVTEDHVELRVSDKGAGIPTEQGKQAVFERFYQDGDHLTGKPAGTGLGLTISREIVTVHGGSIRCEDNPGGGAVFIVSLPMPDSGTDRPIDKLARWAMAQA